MAPILKAMEQSGLILFCAPTYVYHVPGQMKSLLDHLGHTAGWFTALIFPS